MGLEPLLFAMYDESAWVQEMMDFFADFYVAMVERVGPHFQFDLVFFYEDVSVKTSTLVSPELFRKFMMAPYRRMTEAFKQHGMDGLIIDSDGCNDPLIPLWLEAGFTGFGPMEVQAEGMGPVELRKRYGRDLFLIGGMDMRALARDRRTVHEEVMGKLPWLLERGGFVPTIAHAIPPHVSFPHYLYYRELVAECTGDGEEARRCRELRERADQEGLTAGSTVDMSPTLDDAVDAGATREEDIPRADLLRP